MVANRRGDRKQPGTHTTQQFIGSPIKHVGRRSTECARRVAQENGNGEQTYLQQLGSLARTQKCFLCLRGPKWALSEFPSNWSCGRDCSTPPTMTHLPLGGSMRPLNGRGTSLTHLRSGPQGIGNMVEHYSHMRGTFQRPSQ